MNDAASLDEFPYRPYHRPLTPREVEIMDYVVQGLTNKEIAAILGNSVGTITHHIKNVRVKLQARRSNRKELIAAYLASREG